MMKHYFLVINIKMINVVRKDILLEDAQAKIAKDLRSRTLPAMPVEKGLSFVLIVVRI